MLDNIKTNFSGEVTLLIDGEGARYKNTIDNDNYQNIILASLTNIPTNSFLNKMKAIGDFGEVEREIHSSIIDTSDK